MPGLYEYLKDPEVVSYLALRNNPQLADQMRRNDERNYAALLSARKAAAMPDFPQMESRGNPQIEWMNRTGQAISQMKDDPALFEEASKLYAQLIDRMAQSNQLTAEQRNNAWNGYNVPRNQTDPYAKGQIDQQNKMAEIDRRLQADKEMEKTKWGYRQAELAMQNENKMDQTTIKPELEKQKFLAKTQATAIVSLPKFSNLVDETKNIVDALKSHPGMKDVVGFPDSPWASNPMYTIQGTDAADFKSYMEQLEGMSFKEAYETLKGGGAVTEIEGRKATSAVNRMKAATSEAEFNKAANEYLYHMQRGQLLLEKAAKGDFTPLPDGKSGSLESPGQPAQYKSMDEIKRDLSMNKITPEQAKAAYLMLKGK